MGRPFSALVTESIAIQTDFKQRVAAACGEMRTTRDHTRKLIAQSRTLMAQTDAILGVRTTVVDGMGLPGRGSGRGPAEPHAQSIGNPKGPTSNRDCSTAARSGMQTPAFTREQAITRRQPFPPGRLAERHRCPRCAYWRVTALFDPPGAVERRR